MTAEARRPSTALSDLSWERVHGQLKFFAALCLSVDDWKGTLSIDFGGYEYVLVSKHICKNGSSES